MIHPVVVNPVLSPVVRVTDPVRWRAGKLAPEGAILHYDADIDTHTEQTGGPHTFNHAILSPQYQRNADGSYTDVGAKPAVDVFGGEKWLRSCGAVTNLLTSTPITSWVKAGSIVLTDMGDGVYKVSAAAPATSSLGVVTSGVTWPQSRTIQARTVSGTGKVGLLVKWDNANSQYDLTEEWQEFSFSSNTEISVLPNSFYAADFRHPDCTLTEILVRFPAQTQTAYPVPYVPPGVTQPASNATTTNGMWFSLPDGSPLWKALTGQPLTLATRVRMGVGSGDLPAAITVMNVLASRDVNTDIQHFRVETATPTFSGSRAYDRSSVVAISTTGWARNAVIRRFTQVNTAGTQFRVGYMIEGTHTAIQWSGWVAYDGSFDPSTLYRLRLGYYNQYPMWFNKITAWKEQVDDSRILEAMA